MIDKTINEYRNLIINRFDFVNTYILFIFILYLK